MVSADRAAVDLLEEVVALVVDEDEGGEIFDANFPDRLHAEFGVFEDFERLDMVGGEEGGGAAGGAEVEAAVFLAGIGDLLGAVAFGEHDHGATMRLEQVDVSVHAPGSGRAKGAGSHSFGSFGGAGVVDGVLFEVIGKFAGFVEALLEFGVSGVAGDDDCAAEGDRGGDGVLVEGGEDLVHACVEVDGDAFEFPVLVFLGNELAGVGFEFFKEDAVLGDLGFGLSVGGAGDTEADRAGSTVAGETNDACVEGEVFATELRPDADFPGDAEEFLFHLEVAKGAALFVAGGREGVVVAGGGHLHRLQAGLRRSTADDEGEVVWGTGRGAEAAEFFNAEGAEAGGIEEGFGLLVEEGLVGGAAAFGDKEEAVLVALSRVEVELGGEIVFRVGLLKHTERSDLRVAEVLLLVGVEDSAGERFLVVGLRPNLLAFFAHDDGGAGVLAGGEDSVGSDFGVLEEHEGHHAVVVGRLGVVENGGDLLEMAAAQLEGDGLDGLVGEEGEGLGGDFEDGPAIDLEGRDMIAADFLVFGFVGAEGKGGLVVEIHGIGGLVGEMVELVGNPRTKKRSLGPDALQKSPEFSGMGPI